MEKVQPDDRLLIDRSMAGDREAFDQLVAKHQECVYKYAFRLTRDADEAADIVADVFYRMYKAIKNFKGDSAVTTWLYRITTNCYLDMKKKQKSRQYASLDATIQINDKQVQAFEFEDKSPSAFDRTVENQEIEAVSAAVKLLPSYQRAILNLYHGETMSYEEIASMLGVPIGTVKSRLNRARLSLRQLLDPATPTPRPAFAAQLATA